MRKKEGATKKKKKTRVKEVIINQVPKQLKLPHRRALMISTSHTEKKPHVFIKWNKELLLMEKRAAARSIDMEARAEFDLSPPTQLLFDRFESLNSINKSTLVEAAIATWGSMSCVSR